MACALPSAGWGTYTAFGWIVPDLHGNVVAAIGPDATFVNALRFDPDGQTVSTWTATSGSVNLPWRCQGRILESAGSGTTTDLADVLDRVFDPRGEGSGAIGRLPSAAASVSQP
jgi:hypothetical protein